MSVHPDHFRLLSRPVVAWALYDFANTIFSFAVITLYFNAWVIEDRGSPDWHVGVMGFVVGLVLVVLMPVLGAVSDLRGRRLPFLAACTVLCVGATAVLGAMGSAPVVAALVVAGVAIIGFQLALSMYDPLLAVVAPPEYRGRVSGFGVGMGYLGVLVGSQVLVAIVGDGPREAAFVPTALMFAVFALPIFLFVREPRPEVVPGSDAQTTSSSSSIVVQVGASARQVVATVRSISREHREIGRFLVARFLYVDAIATVIAFMTVYMGRLADFSPRTETLVLGSAMVAAALGGFVSGRLVEVVGPKRVLVGILSVTIAALVVAAVGNQPVLVWVLAPVVGITLGAVWTSDRVLMMRLAPPALRGELFGIYNLVGKLSAGVGPLVLWSGTIWVLHDRAGTMSALDATRVALLALAGAVVAGIVVLRPLDDRDRYPGDVDGTVEVGAGWGGGH